ncbi:hypothetical protein [Dokdonella immobilis]|uniref:hypothetical protein n=1 Tax=Dokdonella immobilis TaxID=578942 RepID=UPI000B89F488|nr:hypothetical protein [Dokdonella immobilis]
MLALEPDDDVGWEDWPAAMSDPLLIEPALLAYDRPDARDDERVLIVELLLNVFEFCSVEREGNPDWRGTLDRIERNIDLHRSAVKRWAEPEDGVPWIIGSALQVLLARHSSRG